MLATSSAAATAAAAEVAALDVAIQQERRKCDRELEQAYQRLQSAPSVAFHARVLDTLRAPYESHARELYGNNLSASTGSAAPIASAARWPKCELQRFLARYFAAYADGAAFHALCECLADEDADKADDKAGEGVQEDHAKLSIASFEVLQRALMRDITSRLVEMDANALEPASSFASASESMHDDLALASPEPSAELLHARTQIRQRRQTTPVAGNAARVRSPISTSARNVAGKETLVDDTDTPMLTEFQAEVLKKSPNFLGRWRTRYLYLRWNELEMCKKPLSAFAPGVVPSSPSSPTLQTQNATKSKRYPLRDLLHLEIIALSEHEPNRRTAVNVQFRRPGAHGVYTTKTLTLGSELGQAGVIALQQQLATFALFTALTSGVQLSALESLLRSGARLDVCARIPGCRLTFPLTPLQLAVLPPAMLPETTTSPRAKAQIDGAALQCLLEHRADPRALLQWNYARAVLFSDQPAVRPQFDVLLLPMTVRGNDEPGWTLLMFACFAGNLEHVRQLLGELTERVGSADAIAYIEHVNGSGDTALHIAIKASKTRPDAEAIALSLVEFVMGDRRSPSCRLASPPLLLCRDRENSSVLHLACKAQLWSLVMRLVDAGCNAVAGGTVDSDGNTLLLVALKVGAPHRVLARLIQPDSRNLSQDSNSVLEARDRTANDTALTLAIKRLEEDVVELLLQAGASPDVDAVAWTEGSRAVVVADGDPPLHVAIRTGQARIAMLLVTHGATVAASDSRGASALALAIRYGMYALANSIAMRLIKEGARDREREWMDDEMGMPVTHSAIHAGQLELAALLLDMTQGHTVALLQRESNISLVHLLTRLLELLSRNQEQEGASPPKFSKARSEGSVLKSPQYSTKPLSECSDHSLRLGFSMQAVEVLLTTALQVIVNPSAVFNASRDQAPIEAWMQTFRMPFETSVVLTSSGDIGSPLFAAACAGASGRRVLLLLFAWARWRKTLTSIVRILHSHAGEDNQTVLSAALNRGSPDTGLLLLHAMLSMDSMARSLSDALSETIGSRGETILHLVCAHPRDPKMLMVAELLLQQGAYGGVWDAKGRLPLHVGVQHHADEKLVYLWWQHGQDLNAWTESQAEDDDTEDAAVDVLEGAPRTALMLAVQHSNLAALRALVDCGANIRCVLPRSRLGLLQIAVRLNVKHGGVLRYLLSNEELTKARGTDKSISEAIGILRERLRELDASQGSSSAEALTSSPGPSEESMEPKKFKLLPITLKEVPSRPLASFSSSSISFSSPSSPSRVMKIVEYPPSPTLSATAASAIASLRHRPKPPVLNDTAAEYLREEEKKTLTLVAHEARQEAQDWLRKRIGQRKLLSEARALLQSQFGPKHRRTGSTSSNPGSEPAIDDDGTLLEQYKSIAAKDFIDKHVTESVDEARMEIEREKQAIFQDTGILPGQRRRRLRSEVAEDASSSMTRGNGMVRNSSFPNMTELSDTELSSNVWWSDYGGTGSTFLSDESLTWLSSSHSGTILSDGNSTFAMSAVNRETASRQMNEDADDAMDKSRDPGYQQDRASFMQIINLRNTFS